MTPEELKEARKEIIKKKREATGQVTKIIAELQKETGLCIKDIIVTTTEVVPADGSADYKIVHIRLETDFI